jgi:hypothetical protein
MVSVDMVLVGMVLVAPIDREPEAVIGGRRVTGGVAPGRAQQA